MRKRGQVTSFIIVGIVILIVVALLFVLKDSIIESIKGSEGTKLILDGIIEEIDFKINDCVEKEANEALIILGKQGGTFNQINYRNFYSDRITYLCFAIPDTKKCISSGLTRIELENELNDYLTNRIKNCISIESFRNDGRYKISIGDFKFSTEILDKIVLFHIDYPISLERKEVVVTTSDFSKIINNPLGKIQQAVLDILNVESEIGAFDNVMYVLSKKNEFTVIKKRPWPDRIYVISHKDYNYEFQFAIKG